MTRFQELVSAPTIYRNRPSTFGQLYAILGTILLIGVVAFFGVTYGLGAGTQLAESSTTTEVTDGWMSAITYTNRQREAATTVDGWASALLKPEPPVVDGWASALLKPEPRVIDGWASRYLVTEDD